MFPLLGPWPDNEAEAGACLSSAASCGRLLGGGLPSDPSFLFPETLHCLKGQEWNCKTLCSHSDRCKSWPVGLCCAEERGGEEGGITIRLGFILPPYQVDLAELPPAALHSHALTYICSQRRLFLVSINQRRLYCLSGAVSLTGPLGGFWDTERME